jgi:hypothetical protein
MRLNNMGAGESGRADEDRKQREKQGAHFDVSSQDHPRSIALKEMIA